MVKRSVLVVFSIFLTGAAAAPSEPSSFAGFEFGAKREDVRTDSIARFGLEADARLGGLWSTKVQKDIEFNFNYEWAKFKAFRLKGYKIGVNTYDAYLVFDDNDRLFMIRFGPAAGIPAGKFDQVVWDASFFADIFITRFNTEGEVYGRLIDPGVGNEIIVQYWQGKNAMGLVAVERGRDEGAPKFYAEIRSGKYRPFESAEKGKPIPRMKELDNLSEGAKEMNAERIKYVSAGAKDFDLDKPTSRSAK